MKNFILVLSVIAFIFFTNCMQTGEVDDSAKIKEESVTLREDDPPVSPPHIKWSSQFKITASDAEDYDRFGKVSISGDYIIVGAYGEDGSGTNRGAAYIYHRTGKNTWDAGTKIIAPDNSDGDLFGGAVSISGDYAIVGARDEDGSGTDRGAAYIYHRTGTNTWNAGTKVISPNAADNEKFGNSVSISGNYIIIGSHFEDNIGIERGTAYIYRRTGTITWDSGTRILSKNSHDYDWFGYTVSISNDYAIVGSYHENGGGTGRGAAYIYHRTGTNVWDTGNRITASDVEDYDNFGIKVTISGDYVVVGVLWKDGSGNESGAAYVFK